MRCFSSTAPAASITWTLRKNGANTTLTCTIAGGATTGSGTGTAVTLSAGDLVDVALPAAGNRNVPMSAAIGP
jgi:hypothetical protein